MRLLRHKDDRIKLFSLATVALLIWRTLIVGSRIMIFVMFAMMFQSWLFVVVSFHYMLMFVFVYYQMRYSAEPLTSKHVYNFVTPFVYIFDFCLNWLHGPTSYWYLTCYVPMYIENVLMSGLVLWNASTTPNPAWYMVPGCVCVIVMFPLGVLAQLAYYLYWHPKLPLLPLPRRTFGDFLAKIEKEEEAVKMENNNRIFLATSSLSSSSHLDDLSR